MSSSTTTPFKISPHPPVPAYKSSPNSPLTPNKDFCTTLARADRTCTESFTLPIRSGRAWHAPKGSIIRLSTPEGAQVGDLNLWNAHNARERFWASRTRQLHASHVTVGDRLWSCLPYLRPMVTIIADSLGGDVYGKDKWGGRCHDLLGTRCDPYVNTLLSSTSYDYHCHSNLLRSVLPYGLNESDIHDVLNVFQVTGLDDDGKYFMSASPARKGDLIEFFAEQDLLMALSTCPGGDLSMWGWGEGTEGGEGEAGEGGAEEGKEKKGMLDCCRPLKVEVFRLVDEEKVLAGWEEPKPPAYRGMHGLKIPLGEAQASDSK